MSNSYWRFIPLLLAIFLVCGCSYYQPTKNVWKSTKGLWNEYVSPPASVDYEDKGDLEPEALALSKSMMGVDSRLTRLERVMQNADKPPTQEWLSQFMSQFPWLSGFAGVKYDGSILGQYPAESMKELDFNPLLYEDKKQNSRALRADVQPSPLGPEIMLATPLYDGVDFLGVVVAYFDMRSLMRFSDNADDIVVLCPTALLWPGKYDFAATPLAGVDWAKVVRESAAGTCSNSHGSFFYMVRYLGNLPLVFAIPQKGDFPAGNGELEQGFAFFPKEREKMPPPPLPERKPRQQSAVDSFGKPAEGAEPEEASAGEEQAQEQQPQAQEPQERLAAPQRGEGRRSPNEIQPGSRESMLLKGGGAGRSRQVRERQLEGENIEVKRAPEQRLRPPRSKASEPPLDLVPDANIPTLPGGRPSPFGPRDEQQPVVKRPSPFGPPADQKPAEGAPAETPVQEGKEPAEGPAQAPKAAPEASAPEDNEERLADGEKASGEIAPESSPPAPQAKPEAEAKPEAVAKPESDGPPPKPALLPGGRPSPFGPRN